MPVQGLDRIVVLDVLRGIALLGMLLVHFHDRSDDPGAGIGHAYQAIVDLLLVNRFHAMFAILFGVGFAVQLRRSEARGDRFVVRYARRLVALALFGVLAQGVFGFAILFGYALWGFALLLVRRWSIRALVVTLVACSASPALYWGARAGYDAAIGGVERVRSDPGLCRVPLVVMPSFRASATCRDAFQRFVAMSGDARTSSNSTSFLTVVTGRLRAMWQEYSRPSATALFTAGDLPYFLLGLLGLRLGVFERPREHRRLILTTMGCFTVAAVVTNLFVYPEWRLVSPTAPLVGQVIVNIGASAFLRDMYDALIYIGAILLLVTYRPAWLGRLSAFGITGRMALTNYMAQIIVIDLLFSRYALGLTISPISGLFLGVVIFIADIAFCRWWLVRYRYGPLEWIWRSATYWKCQPMRVSPLRVTPS